MKKVRLDLDDLVVESFATENVRRGFGTVQGAGASENPCASENATCWCTMNIALDVCASLDEGCQGGTGASNTCPENQNNTCAYGCTLGAFCTDYCNSVGGTCAINTCWSVCGGDAGDSCGCNISERGTCVYDLSCGGDTCADAHCVGHGGGWGTNQCANTKGMPIGPSCDARCINQTEGEVTCVMC